MPQYPYLVIGRELTMKCTMSSKKRWNKCYTQGGLSQKRCIYPRKLTAGYPKWWFGKGNSLQTWQFLVSMLDFWVYTCIPLNSWAAPKTSMKRFNRGVDLGYYGRERWRKQTCFAKGPRKLTMIEVYLEPDTSNYKRLFQLDDSNSLHRKRSFNQTSILKLLFRLPGINLVCQFFFGIYRENPRKWGERSAKASRKVQVPSSRVGPFQSQPLILVYFFQLYTASDLDDFKPKGFLFKPKHILKPLSPRKSCERWWCPDTIAKAKMMVANVSRKVLRKGYMSISQWSLGFDHRSVVICHHFPSWSWLLGRSLPSGFELQALGHWHFAGHSAHCYLAPKWAGW